MTVDFAVAAFAVLAASGLGLIVYAAFVEPRRIARTFLRVVLPELASASRYLVLADTHLTARSSAPFRRIAEAAAWAHREGADATMLLGDILERDDEADVVADRLARTLAPLRAIYVSGNHEMDRSSRVHWPLPKNDHARIVAALERHGFTSADGAVLERPGGLRLIGLPWQGWRVGPDPSALRAFDGLAGAVVLLTHSPDHVVGVPRDRVRFALCGHTHGGQLRLPLVGAPWAPADAPLPSDFGLMSLGGIPTYLTRGLGATIPLRFRAQPEVVLVEFAPDRSSPRPAGASVVEHPPMT